MADVTIEVFYSPTCPHCPAQKQLAQDVASEDVDVTLTDVTKQQGRAQQFSVRTVPTTIVTGPAIDERLGFTGVMSDVKLQDAVSVARGDLPVEEIQADSLVASIKQAIFGND